MFDGMEKSGMRVNLLRDASKRPKIAKTEDDWQGGVAIKDVRDAALSLSSLLASSTGTDTARPRLHR